MDDATTMLNRRSVLPYRKHRGRVPISCREAANPATEEQAAEQVPVQGAPTPRNTTRGSRDLPAPASPGQPKPPRCRAAVATARISLGAPAPAPTSKPEGDPARRSANAGWEHRSSPQVHGSSPRSRDLAGERVDRERFGFVGDPQQTTSLKVYMQKTGN